MEKEIVYTDHLQLRLKIREIDSDLPRQVYEEATERYFDIVTEYNIAVGEAYYKGKYREMAVIYSEMTWEIRLITIYPLKSYEKISKIESGRWRKR